MIKCPQNIDQPFQEEMTMTIGTELPAFDINKLAQSLLGRSSSPDHVHGHRGHGGPGRSDERRGHHDDQVVLSEEAQNLLSNLQNAFFSQRQKDIGFASQQLKALQEQISFASALLESASDEQQGIILDFINDLIGSLGETGNAIGGLLGGGGSDLESLFNGAAANAGGVSVSYAEKLNVELNITRISERTESLEVTQGEDGSITVEHNITQTEIVQTELKIEQEQSLVIQQNAGSDNSGPGAHGRQNADLRHLLNEFRDTIRQFADLLKKFGERFGNNDDLLNTLSQLVGQLLGGEEAPAPEAGSEPVLVDLAA